MGYIPPPPPRHEEHRCQCKICIETREFFAIITHLNPDDQEWMENFFEKYTNEALDAEVNVAIIEGSWPTADEQIAYARQQRKERNVNNKE